MRALAALVGAACVLAAAAAVNAAAPFAAAKEGGPRAPSVPLPTFPQTYTAYATLTLPYADITEPMTYYYDATAAGGGAYRTDYYGGLNSYIYSVAANMTYQVMPMGANTTGCLYIPGAVSLASVFPDLSQFAYRDAEPCPGNEHAGDTCNTWVYTNSVGNKTNTYTFWALAGEQGSTPVRYEMMGYDSLFGSHYDQYLLDYGVVDTDPIDPEVFAKPNPTAITCNPFPGTPGMAAAGNPINEWNTQPHKKAEHTHVDRAFTEWTHTHGKRYPSALHREQRKRNFHNNLRFINAHNRQGKTYKVALNHLADTTREERDARLGTRAPPAFGNGAKAFHTVTYARDSLPPAIDWRVEGAVTAVKDQGVCGSCWSFGSHESIEGAHFLKTGKLVRLASQALVDCSWITGNTGCDGGNDFLAYQWLLNYNGGKVPTEDSYPYLMANGQCHADRAATGAVITGYVNVTSGSETALQDALVTSGPISVSIDASHDSLSFYSSGVYYEPQCGNGVNDLDHTVLAVGYGTMDGQDYWIVKNSWSTHWGDEGYVYMSRQNNNCGVATAPTYVTM